MSPPRSLIAMLALFALPATPLAAGAAPSTSPTAGATREPLGLSAAAAAPPQDLSAAAVLAPTGFRWPLSPARVVRRFDPPPRPWLPGHRGVDLAGVPFQDVRAAGGGTVIFAGLIAGRGVVSVAHAGGLRTTYEPVTPSVAVGDAVEVGTKLGQLDAGHPGCAEAACLHWGLRRGDLYLDPLALLGLGRVRLLPTTDLP